jgi:hypothetical protein
MAHGGQNRKGAERTENWTSEQTAGSGLLTTYLGTTYKIFIPIGPRLWV